MSIANELREYALGWDERNRVRCDLTAIADRIDAEHERILRETGERIVNEWVCLPKDADGVPIHVGDVMDGNRGTVTCIRDAGHGWEIVTDHMYSYNPADLHHHTPTVEDVLREFVDKALCVSDVVGEDELVTEYAAKVREVLGK